MTHIYVAGSSRDGPLKIGITTNTKKRLAQLQTGCAVSLRIYWSLDVPPSQAARVEREAHTCFSPE
jgi:hypothetical protein